MISWFRFQDLTGDHEGVYYPLTGMTKIVQQKLIDDHFLFKVHSIRKCFEMFLISLYQEGDRFLQTANACRYWPTGRGIFHNNAKTFLVWCGEEDHLRIISMQMGGLGQFAEIDLIIKIFFYRSCWRSVWPPQRRCGKD